MPEPTDQQKFHALYAAEGSCLVRDGSLWSEQAQPIIMFRPETIDALLKDGHLAYEDSTEHAVVITWKGVQYMDKLDKEVGSEDDDEDEG